MPKLGKVVTSQAGETSSEKIVNQANIIHTIEDENGRKIELKKPGALAQYKLIEMLGAETARNQVYIMMILPLMYVNKIDGVSVFVDTKNELDALIQRLDHAGIQAVNDAVEEHFADKRKNDEASENLKK